MKKFAIIILLASPQYLWAQSLSIQDLWNQYRGNSKYQQTVLNTQIKTQELKELQTDRIPVFYVDGNLQHNIIIPTTPVPAIAFDPSAQEGAIIPLKFATKWSSKAGVQVQWKLFDPQRKYSEDQKSLEIEKAEIELQRTEENWKKDATLAYAAVVLASYQYQSALEDSVAYAEILQITKNRYKVGRESSSNYISAQQQFERQLIQLYEAFYVLKQVDLELNNYIDIKQYKNLSSGFEDIKNAISPRDKNYYDIQSLMVDKRIVDNQWIAAKRQWLPSLTLNGYLGEQYYSNELRITRKEEWFGNSFINLALRIPLSSYFTGQATLRKIQLNSKLIDLQITEKQADDQSLHNKKQLKIAAAEEKLHRLEKIKALALQDMNEQREAYKAGRALITMYNQSLINYKKAEQDVWQAQYDLIKTILD